MPLTKLQIRPGVVRDTTSYANEGGWYYCDKVRFRSGSPEKIGGWVRLTQSSFLGTCTALLPWSSLGGVLYTAVGTNVKYYIEYGSALIDITPIRDTAALGANPFTTSNGSTTVVVAYTAHGALLGDYVTFSGAVGPVNSVPASELNAEHAITRIIDANSYEIIVATAATAAGSGGGASVSADYQINVGLPIQLPAGGGWSNGAWGQNVWGGAASGNAALAQRLWTQGTFGEDLVFCARNGSLFYWDTSVGITARAVYLEDMAGADSVPVVSAAVLVTDSRHIVALGCNPYEDPPNAEQDPLLVRWSDTESAVDWVPTATNTAGGYRLSLGSTILCARNARLETLIWTDSALYSMAYVGGGLEFGFSLLATPISLVGPNAVAVVGGTAFWMGNDKFYIYNGAVSTLPCPLLKILIDGLNHAQACQTFAGTNEQFTEVTWFYCSLNSLVVDSYITYNYGENFWYFGTFNRSAWADSGIVPTPIAADNVNNVLVYHEVGTDDVSTGTPVAIESYIESSDVDLGDGHQFMFISRVLPDVSFIGSTAASPALTLTLKTRNAPGATWINSVNQPSNSPVTNTALNSVYTSPVEQYTEQLWVRLRGRQMAVRIASNTLGVAWQVGALRVDLRPDGRR